MVAKSSLLVAYWTEAAADASPVRVTKISAEPAFSPTEAAAVSNCTVFAGAGRVQGSEGVESVRGLAAAAVKSAALLSVSAQPSELRKAAVVCVGAAKTAGPSAQVAAP